MRSSNVIRSVITGGKAIVNCLTQDIYTPVKHVWGYSGGANLPLLDAFYNLDKTNLYMTSHEQGAGHCAQGYAKVTGNLGVAITTSGPGLTNIITPLYDAKYDGVPLLVLSGQVPTSAIGTEAFQECPAIEATKPFTKWSYQLTNLDAIPKVISFAMDVAMSGRPGPVHIDIPKDISAGPFWPELSGRMEITQSIVDEIQQVADKLNDTTSDNDPDISLQIEQITKLLHKAKRPILYVGQGANNDSVLLRKIVDQFKIPVTTTIHAMGVVDELKCPYSIGFLGMHGYPAANKAIQNADLIIALGSRFDDRTTGNLEYYAPEAKKAAQESRGGIVHVNLHKPHINFALNTDINCCTTVEHFLTQLNLKIKDDNIQIPDNWSEWRCQIKKWQKKYPLHIPRSKNITPQDVVYLLDLLTQPRDDIIYTTGVGSHQMFTCQYINWRKPRTYIGSGSAGTMGVGLPFAIGAQIAEPDKTVILLDGDGSFNMTNQELRTVMEYQLPIKMVIFNDGHQGMVRNWQDKFCGERYILTENMNGNYNLLAEAYGIENLKVNNKNDLRAALQLMLESTESFLLNVEMEYRPCYPLVAPGKALDDMLFGNQDKVDTTQMAPN